MIVSIGKSPPQTRPRIVKTADYYNGSTSNGLYYTVLDIAGSGKLFRVSASLSGNAKFVHVRLTVDGNQYTIDVINGGYAGPFNVYTRALAGDVGERTDWLDYICSIDFKNSLKVEVMEDGGNSILYCSVDYALN